MEVSKKTIEILNNFASINQSLYVYRTKELKTIGPGNSIIARADIEEEWPCKFGIYDLPEFLAALNLFKSPNLEFAEDGTCVNITDSEKSKKVRYYFASGDMFDHPYPTDDRKEITINLPPTEVNFMLTQEMLTDLTKASNVLQLTDFNVKSENNKLYGEAINIDNPTSNVYTVDLEGEVPDADFNLIFKFDNLRLVSRDYDVGISKHKISHLISDDIEYWISLDLESTYSE